MAVGTTLKMKFETMSGVKTWSFKYAKPNASLANVKALGAAMISNGSIYQNPPVRLSSAIMSTTTETVYDIDE